MNTHPVMKARPAQFLLSAWLLGSASLLIVGCDNRGEKTAASAPKATAGVTIDDSIVTTKVISRLLADPVVKGLNAKVETNNGRVLLGGVVDSQAQMDRATEIARAVEGVKSVDN